ncbi:MAG: AAA family ATPase [Spirochaetales bacterium]
MIERIIIDKFGKFKNREFFCKPITVFYGANESGKTTLFDALFAGLCKPKGSIGAAKRLRERYGEYPPIEVKFVGPSVQFAPADFLNLFAVRSGDLRVEGDSNWLTTIKAQLFSGGIDPQEVANRIKYKITSKAKGTLLSEEIELETQLVQIQKEIEKLQKEAESVQHEAEEASRLEEELKQIQVNLTREREDLRRLEYHLDQQKKQAHLQQLREIYQKLDTYKALEEELHKEKLYTEEEYRTLQQKELNLRQLERDLDQIRIKQEEGYRLHLERQREGENLEKELRRLTRSRDLGSLLKDKVQNRTLFERPKITFHPIWGLLGGIAFLSGIILALGWFRDTPYLPFIIGSSVGLLLFGLGLRKKNQLDEALFQSAVTRACKEWKEETGENLHSENWENLLLSIQRREERYRILKDQFERFQENLSTENRRLSEIQQESIRLDTQYQTLKRELDQNLSRLGVRELTQYVQLLEKLKQRQNLYHQLSKDLEEACKQYGQSDFLALKGFLKAELERLSDQIKEKAVTVAEVKLLENQFRERKERLAILEKEEQRILTTLNRKQGEISVRTQGIPQKLLLLQKQGVHLQNLKMAKKQEIEGAKIAQQIYEEIGEDTSILIQELSEEISRDFSRITARPSPIQMSALTFKDVGVSDAGGEIRKGDGEALSSGTRDAFYLAARLTLARRALAGSEPGILVLDEPFLTLDKNRCTNALSLLKEFYKKQGWQIFFFTKEEALVKEVEGTFKEESQKGLVQVHKLD